MGQIFAALNSQPIPVGGLSNQRTPVYDGVSGLNYSGRVYATQFSPLAAGGKEMCKDVGTVSASQIGDIRERSISSPGLTIDDTTKRIAASALQGHIAALESQGLIPGLKGTVDEQIREDTAFYKAVEAEYCFYEARYRTAMTEFLGLIANPATANDPSAKQLLEQTTSLNRRLNSLLELLNYIGNARARAVNDRSPRLEEANKELQKKLNVLTQQRDYITSSDVKLRTQAEMIRFSAEKSRAMNIQIAAFVALNVVALGSLVVVYQAIGK